MLRARASNTDPCRSGRVARWSRETPRRARRRRYLRCTDGCGFFEHRLLAAVGVIEVKHRVDTDRIAAGWMWWLGDLRRARTVARRRRRRPAARAQPRPISASNAPPPSPSYSRSRSLPCALSRGTAAAGCEFCTGGGTVRWTGGGQSCVEAERPGGPPRSHDVDRPRITGSSAKWHSRSSLTVGRMPAAPTSERRRCPGQRHRAGRCRVTMRAGRRHGMPQVDRTEGSVRL
jgi:hypothetical protein